MNKSVLAIPAATLLLIITVWLNVPLIREITVFAYLTFLPGFVILRLFKFKELSILNTLLFSVGLSIGASFLVTFLVNQTYLLIGVPQPLSVIPLTAAISVFTIVLFLIGYRSELTVNLDSLNSILHDSKRYLPLASVLLILPILSIAGALYVNIPIMIIVFLVICGLVILSVSSDKLIPSKFYPFLILSISISILLLTLLISKYTLGDDANYEYYVFKITQLRGFWGPISADTNSMVILDYNSMLSVTLLPNIYSILMNLSSELLFKILYSFIFSLVPLALYGIYRNYGGKLIGLLSVFFFVFTTNAFFGELTSVNRQILAEFFLVLSLLIWLNKTLPIREKRILLIIFGVSVGVSHYSLALIYIIFIFFLVLFSSLRSRSEDSYTASVALSITGITFLYYAFSPGPILNLIVNMAKTVIAELTNFNYTAGAGSVGAVAAFPQVFTVSSWINLVASGATNLLLVLGVFAVILFARKMELSEDYRIITVFGAIIFAISLLFPSVASTLNFTRFYAIALLFLSPCFIIGALFFLKAIQLALSRKNENLRRNLFKAKRTGAIAIFLIAILLCTYSLSQSGFVNYVTGGAIHSQTFDYYKMQTSNNIQGKIQFYQAYIQEQDAVSATWLSRYIPGAPFVYSDYTSKAHILVSRGLIPGNQLIILSNTTRLQFGSFLYLDTLNLAQGIIPVSPTDVINVSDISSSFNHSNSIYSNGNSEIWSPAGSS
jgi:uncharacterized membrane protein